MTLNVRRLNTRLPLAVAALALLAATTGCGGATGTGLTSTDTQNITTAYVTVPDGRSVLCVAYSTANAGGIDCDWATAAREGDIP